MELPTDDASMEDGGLSCCRQHNGAKTSQGIENSITVVIPTTNYLDKLTWFVLVGT